MRRISPAWPMLRLNSNTDRTAEDETSSHPYRVRYSTLLNHKVMQPLMAYVIYLVHFSVLMYVGSLDTGSFSTGTYVTISAYILISVGLFIYLAAFLKLGVAKSSHIEFSGFVTTGVYRFIRDPQILAWLLVLTGISLYLSSYYALLLTAALWLFFKMVFQPIEDKKLTEQYGKEYIEYKNRTVSGV